MLAQLEPATDNFHTLVRYLINGRERPPNPDRVAWIRAFQLATDDPEQVATIMAATAKLSKRCKNPCYHAIIAWALDEHPTPEEMLEVALDTLDLAGLGEHQAFIIGHGDKDHPHLHMMINRVHPDTGKAWSTADDYKKFALIMKQMAHKHGFQHVPAHAFEPEATDELPKKPNSRATYAGKRGAATTRPQWPKATSRAFGDAVSEELTTVGSWDELDKLLADDGLAIEPKGKGLVVGDAQSYSKFSALGLSVTAADLMHKLGPRPVMPKAARRLRRRNDGHRDHPERGTPSKLSPPPAMPAFESRTARSAQAPPEEVREPLTMGRFSGGVSPPPIRPPPATRNLPPMPSQSASMTEIEPSRLSAPSMVFADDPTYRRRPFWEVDAVDIARLIGTQEDVRRHIRASVADRRARLQDASLLEQLEEELKECLRASTFLSPPKRKSRPAERHRKPSEGDRSP